MVVKQQLEQIKRLLSQCTKEQRNEVFNVLRAEFPIHPLEAKLNAQAEIILEAIDRASPLTLRGIRGVIAEAAFEINIVTRLTEWQKLDLTGNLSYDFRLRDSIGEIRIQVKMQRLKNKRPMKANEGYRWLPEDMYVVETQRTRGGKNVKTGQNTRPYRFGEFDILAVSLHPSTNDWSRFIYTVASWLIPDSEDATRMLKFQPVAIQPATTWTDDFQTCVMWLRSSDKRSLI